MEIKRGLAAFILSDLAENPELKDKLRERIQEELDDQKEIMREASTIGLKGDGFARLPKRTRIYFLALMLSSYYDKMMGYAKKL